MAKRKFTGMPFTIQEKCLNCNQLELCQKNNQSLTAKEIVLDCEGFYYVFKKLEQSEQRPKFDGNLRKYEEAISVYDEQHLSVPDLCPPFVVNGALAAELALRAILKISNNQHSETKQRNHLRKHSERQSELQDQGHRENEPEAFSKPPSP